MARTSQTDQPTLAFINGNVLTMNDGQPRVEAFIVTVYGVFLELGSNDEILAEAKRHKIPVRNLGGAFVMPGIHDAHMHVLASGLARNSEVMIPMDSTFENIAKRVQEGNCACHYAHAYEDWIFAGSYSHDNFPESAPDRKYLDELFPDTPVAVHGGAAHSLLANTAALLASGYSLTSEPSIPGAVFGRRVDGTLSGELQENAMTKLTLNAPKPDRLHVKRVLKAALCAMHKAGVTSCQEASANTALIQGLHQLERDSDLKADVYCHIVHGPEWIAQEGTESLQSLIDQTGNGLYKTKHVHTNYIKIISDGVPLPPLFTHCGLDGEGHAERGKLLVQDAEDAVLKYDEKGLTVKVHCTGHGATRLALDAFEKARKKNPGGPRHEIAHCSGVHDDDYKRFQELNITAEMSPAPLFAHPLTQTPGSLMDWNFRKMLSANAHITIGSDWGAVPDPTLFPHLPGVLESISELVGGREKAAELICKILTLNGAIAVGREKESGSIEVGKRANFIILNKDLGRGEFEGAEVLETWFEGECVFEKEI